MLEVICVLNTKTHKTGNITGNLNFSYKKPGEEIVVILPIVAFQYLKREL